VTVDRIDNRLVIDADDFNIDIMLIGQEIVPGLGRKYLISDYGTAVEEDNPTPNFFAFDYEDEEEATKNLIFGSEKAVRYRVSSTTKDGFSMSNHPVNGYESIVRKVSSLIKNTPSKIKGKKIKNDIQGAIINKWYEGKVSESCSKIIKKPLIEMADGLSFLTTSLYRKVKSNMGSEKLTSYFSRMVALRLHCEEFRSDSDFINDFFKYNAVSHMLNNSYLDSSLCVKWGIRDLDDYSSFSVETVDSWRALFATRGVECPNKRYIIDNLPRSIPAHVVHKIRSSEYDQKSADRIYVLFRSCLMDYTERRINKILDSQIFDIDDLKNGLRLFNDFIYKFDGITKPAKSYKRRKKPSYRKSSVINSFCLWLEKSKIVDKCDEIVSSGFCFSSILDLTKAVCLESMDRILETESTSLKSDRKDKIRRMKKKFLKEHQDVVEINDDLNIMTYCHPPF